jgi:hypothetical protein
MTIYFVKGDKVYDVRFNRLLPTELYTFKLTVSQVAPENPLNVSSVISQFYGIFLK